MPAESIEMAASEARPITFTPSSRGTWRDWNAIGLHAATLYYMVERPLLDGCPELESRAAIPEDGPSRALARVPASRVPSWQVNPALSPNGQWLAMPLTDGFITNIWALSTRTGAWRQVTDFGDRATFIARRVSGPQTEGLFWRQSLKAIPTSCCCDDTSPPFRARRRTSVVGPLQDLPNGESRVGVVQSTDRDVRDSAR